MAGLCEKGIISVALCKQMFALLWQLSLSETDSTPGWNKRKNQWEKAQIQSYIIIIIIIKLWTLMEKKTAIPVWIPEQ